MISRGLLIVFIFISLSCGENNTYLPVSPKIDVNSGSAANNSGLNGTPGMSNPDPASISNAHISQGGQVSITLLSHFANWWGCGNWDGTSGTTPLRRSAECANGYYSLDTKVIQEQNAEMQAYGITPLISWWGVDRTAGDVFLDKYLTIPSPVKFGILYEAAGLLQADANGRYSFSNQANVQKFVADIVHLHTRYFANSKYQDRILRIDGRPVVFIWLTNAFYGPFTDAVRQVRQRVPMFLIGSDFNMAGSVRSDWANVIPALDALSAYGSYDTYFTRKYGRLNRDYTEQYKYGLVAWSEFLLQNAPHVKLIPPFEFAYNDSQRRPKDNNPILQSTNDEARVFAQAAYDAMECSVAGKMLKNTLPVGLDVSYSEHAEGTAVEPSVEYQDGYIRILRDIFRRSIDPLAVDRDNSLCGSSVVIQSSVSGTSGLSQLQDTGWRPTIKRRSVINDGGKAKDN